MFLLGHLGNVAFKLFALNLLALAHRQVDLVVTNALLRLLFLLLDFVLVYDIWVVIHRSHEVSLQVSVHVLGPRRNDELHLLEYARAMAVPDIAIQRRLHVVLDALFAGLLPEIPQRVTSPLGN